MKSFHQLLLFGLISPISANIINEKSGSRTTDDRSRIRRESIRYKHKAEDRKHKNSIPKRIPITRGEQHRKRFERSERMKRRREEVKVKIKEMIENPGQYKSVNATMMTEDEMDRVHQRVLKEDPEFELPQNQWFRNVWGSYKGYNSEEYQTFGLADPSAYYDEWAQAYRMLGAFITCDEGDMIYYNGEEERECTRWILWAAVRFEFVDLKY